MHDKFYEKTSKQLLLGKSVSTVSSDEHDGFVTFNAAVPEKKSLGGRQLFGKSKLAMRNQF